eukprot:9775815-Lingulodinium_polyedra.AAC.1
MGERVCRLQRRSVCRAGCWSRVLGVRRASLTGQTQIQRAPVVARSERNGCGCGQAVARWQFSGQFSCR